MFFRRRKKKAEQFLPEQIVDRDGDDFRPCPKCGGRLARFFIEGCPFRPAVSCGGCNIQLQLYSGMFRSYYRPVPGRPR